MSKEECKIRALVVDDNEVNRMVLANMLELYNIAVDQVDSGHNAAKSVQNKKYDIIFIDHYMPEMDGIQTTELIRRLESASIKSVIIALTADITKEEKSMYQNAGADDVYTKPLGLAELIHILGQWFPERMIQPEYKQSVSRNDETMIKTVLKDIGEINYNAGITYAAGNPIQYMNILKISEKNMRVYVNRIIMSCDSGTVEDLKTGVHNLKSIFSNIGANGLADETKNIENSIIQGNYISFNIKLNQYIRHLLEFSEKLNIVLKKYNKVKQTDSQKCEKVYVPMSNAEYEQSLSNTIYYIKRYEYDLIINEIETLLHRGKPEMRNGFYEALEEIRNFNYDNALKKIIDIKENRFQS